ncbi:AmmeMemoRadiSam system protein B [Nitrospina watsonii]|uniref:MEMO1 family protein NSPWAT_0365 n=1 Tax=Nitrospina watsonii TaxID=1323948 RepID=A0ABM9HAS5_9BACT|nr:AmmeMemoRadiSam system protein B [Nitrospina watsonii]CAI2717224.1 MEMO1 family protein NSPWAT_v2_0365 [Nitrospina watsonii]
MSRQPAVSGRFYPDDPQALRAEVKSHLPGRQNKVQALGVVAPHAGFMYSGDVAGSVYDAIEIPERILILGPNHTGMGRPLSIMSQGAWSMPMGDVEIDTELAAAIRKHLPDVEEDEAAHRAEHSLETQLPFLQYYRTPFRFVPLCLMRFRLEDCVKLGHALARAIAEVEGPVLLVASSDMTHYESHDSATLKDHRAIDRMRELDAAGLHRVVHDNQITMCGVNPATVMLTAAKDLGAQQSVLSQYMTSGEVSGDMERVVGYAGMIVS